MVLHGDPSDEIERVHAGILCAVRDDEVVVGLPGHAAGDVGDFRFGAAGLGGRELPGQRWLKDGIVAERGKQRLAGQSELQNAVDLDDGLRRDSLRVAVDVGDAGRVAAADDLAGENFKLLSTLYLEINRFALVKRKQHFLGDGVSAIALL